MNKDEIEKTLTDFYQFWLAIPTRTHYMAGVKKYIKSLPSSQSLVESPKDSGGCSHVWKEDDNESAILFSCTKCGIRYEPKLHHQSHPEYKKPTSQSIVESQTGDNSELVEKLGIAKNTLAHAGHHVLSEYVDCAIHALSGKVASEGGEEGKDEKI